MKSIILSFILSNFLTFTYPSTGGGEEPIRFMLIISDPTEEKELAGKFITDNFEKSWISTRFEYTIKETFSDDNYDYPITEIFYGTNKLGTIYGIPTSDFLSRILPSLEDQVLSLEKFNSSN